MALALAAGCGQSTASLLTGDAGSDSTSVGKTGRVVGGPCLSSNDCAAGSECLGESEFPGGTCTVRCATNAQCPAGAACVEESDGSCLLTCTSATDCRAGYVCKLMRLREGSVEVQVCGND
jgi:hypothetical protein